MEEVAVKFVWAHKVSEYYTQISFRVRSDLNPRPTNTYEVYLDLSRARARKAELDGQTGRNVWNHERNTRLIPNILAVTADNGATVTLLSLLNTHDVHRCVLD